MEWIGGGGTLGITIISNRPSEGLELTFPQHLGGGVSVLWRWLYVPDGLKYTSWQLLSFRTSVGSSLVAVRELTHLGIFDDCVQDQVLILYPI